MGSISPSTMAEFPYPNGRSFAEAHAEWQAQNRGLVEMHRQPFDAQAYWKRVADSTRQHHWQDYISLADTRLAHARMHKDRAACHDWPFFVECLARAMANDWEYGFIFCGKPGTGKSTLLSLVKKYGYTGQSKDFWTVKNATDLAREHAMLGKDAASASWECSHFAIDDLGVEPLANNFGVKTEAIGEILESRWKWFDTRRQPTIVCTNMDPSAIARRYGDRVDSRMKGMMVMIEMQTTDQRGRR